ncbi:unnamed protein product [Penicillium olsonii]|nr:unnamed protein product [Penicillium olsonii]
MPRGRPKSQLAPCRFCNREFKRLEHLKRHERTHTQEKPFHCQCGKYFSRQDLLSRHERLHHAKGSTNRSNSTLASPELVEETGDGSYLQIDDSTQLQPSLHGPAWSDTTLTGSNVPPVTESSYGMDMTQDALQLPVLSWDNDAFSFDDFIPSHFLDTDVSLSDLFQQAPVHKELGPNALAGSGSFSELQNHTLTQNPNSVSHNALHDNMNLKQPPRFPSMGDHVDISNMDTRSNVANCPWAVSLSDYKIIVDRITTPQTALLNMPIPSKCALVRYLEGYFRKFHDHLPFLHAASFRPENIGIELLLSMSAVGAFYCFENAEGYRLYGTARSLINYALESQRRKLIDRLTSQAPRSMTKGVTADQSVCSPPLLSHTAETPQSDYSSIEGEGSQARLERAQALIILTAVGAWGDKSLLKDSLAMSSQLADLVRQLGISKPDDASKLNLGWVAWTAHEQLRRTLLVAYIILNLNSIISDVPPVILTHEVALCLPSCEAEWGANSAVAWQRHREVSALRERPLVQTLNQLFAGQSICDDWGVSAFSNYVLIIAIIQKIYFEIQICRDTVPIQPELLKTFERALKLWQHSWETTWESTLDPNSPKGPIGFNATAILRLAYIRLNIRRGLCHSFVASDNLKITEVFANLRGISLSRNAPLDRAILQCIHALSIPVRVGIQNVARTQVMHWGIQHLICHLECALLLAIWVQNIAEAVQANGIASLRGDEIKLLTMVKGLVKETHLKDSIVYHEETAANMYRLAVSIARLWAEISGGTHIFDIVYRVGNCLSVISNTLELEHSAL